MKKFIKALLLFLLFGTSVNAIIIYNGSDDILKDLVIHTSYGHAKSQRDTEIQGELAPSKQVPIALLEIFQEGKERMTSDEKFWIRLTGVNSIKTHFTCDISQDKATFDPAKMNSAKLEIFNDRTHDGLLNCRVQFE